MECQTYRIEVSAHSKLYYFFICSIFFLWLWALWLWPYYMPNTQKICLSFLLFLVFLFEVKTNKNRASKNVLLIGSNGRFVLHSNRGIKAGWLQSSSQIYIGFFVLKYNPELGTSPQVLVVYTDQINTLNQRRLSRVIRAVQFERTQ